MREDPLALAVSQHALSPEQAALVTGPLAECSCAVCVGVALLEADPDDAALQCALERFRAWSTSVGPLQ